ncbi:MaoC family dehydratase [Patulibacter minatonensis]|uniref:MaoC family dehydratase n=1 Tax=Patulibacter minatonensis TaxID=298163 RepID=UPI000569431C|nr:MaoC family dehydratase [Patulibacter minatonensis]
MTTTNDHAVPAQLSIGELIDYTGKELGVSRWVSVTQAKVDAFAEATGTRQRIDERAASTAFEGPIAHGFLTLALAPAMLADILDLSGYEKAQNSGIDRLRFLAPVPVNSRIRLHVVVSDAQIKDNVGQIRLALTFEIQGTRKPACVATALYHLIEGSDGH